jgi:hypothetical protein
MVYNCVVVVVVVVVLIVSLAAAAAVVVVRYGCCNGYLFHVMLCLFFWNIDHEKERGRKCWVCTKSKLFLLEIWYSTDMILGSAKNVHVYKVPQRFGF